MHKPNPTAIYYSATKTRYDYPSRRYISRDGDNGTLWSMGIYPTKIRAKDLPDYYIYVYLYGGYKYLRTTNVKDLYYKPNKWVNHFLKDDVLYISYNHPLIIEQDKFGYETCNNYDIALFGNDIMSFVAAVKHYSNYDVSHIEQAIKDKLEWYKHEFPDDAELLGDWKYDPEEYDKKVREHTLWRGI